MEFFAQILFTLWEAKTTGRLRLKNDIVKKDLNLQDGNIAIDEIAFDEKAFLKYLSTKKILSHSSIKKCEDHAVKAKIPILSALLDLELLSPSRLWKNMEVFAKGELFFLFDQHPIGSSLVSDKTLLDSPLLFVIPSIPFIREGIHHMENFSIIDSCIPEDIKTLQKLSPDHKEAILLEPHEEYLLHNMGQKTDLKSLLSSSLLGEKNTKKILFFLLNVGIIGSPLRATPNKPLQEFSAAELRKILDTFNTKCSTIFKYVSKELGPVALNLMEKSIEDVKLHLSPHFQKIRLGMDGKIDLHSVLKSNIVFSERESIQSIIKSLNEILTAEILTVKKTLGNDSESALIKNLEKIGV
jgi:hypothetical protein